MKLKKVKRSLHRRLATGLLVSVSMTLPATLSAAKVEHATIVSVASQGNSEIAAHRQHLCPSARKATRILSPTRSETIGSLTSPTCESGLSVAICTELCREFVGRHRFTACQVELHLLDRSRDDGELSAQP